MASTEPFAAYIGIDWADQLHAVCLLLPDGKTESTTLPQKPEAIAHWVLELRQRFGDRPIAVCLEQSRGALAYALMEHPALTLYPINPHQLAAYRQAFGGSGAKSDRADAALLARLLREHRDRLRPWQPDDDATRGLRLLVEMRRKWVEQRVKHGNQLLDWLKISYPQALDLCGQDLHAPAFLAILKKFPTLAELQRASPAQLEKYLPQRRRASDDPPAEELRRQRIAAIRAATPLTRDTATLTAARMAILHLVGELEHLRKSIDDCERKIAELMAVHPDAPLFAALPGAGPVLAPRLVVAFGGNREKFAEAGDLQQLSGIAPVTKQSGKLRVVHRRWACSNFLRQTFHEFAMGSAKFSRWAKAFIAMRKAQGRGYHASIRALAFKWQRILFRCWKLRQPYDEERYLLTLKEKQSPLLKFLPPETP